MSALLLLLALSALEHSRSLLQVQRSRPTGLLYARPRQSAGRQLSMVSPVKGVQNMADKIMVKTDISKATSKATNWSSSR
jgi:hypothetical protein